MDTLKSIILHTLEANSSIPDTRQLPLSLESGAAAVAGAGADEQLAIKSALTSLEDRQVRKIYPSQFATLSFVVETRKRSCSVELDGSLKVTRY